MNAPARRLLLKEIIKKNKIKHLPDVVVPVITQAHLRFLPCSLLRHLLRHCSLPCCYLCSPPLHLCSFLLCLLAHLVLHLCLGPLRLFTRSSLHLFPVLLLLSLDLLASTPLLCFGIKDGRLIFATGLKLWCCHLGPVLGLDRRGNSGGGGLGNVQHVVRGQRTEGTGKTGLIFIDPKFILRQTLWTPHCPRRPHQPHWGLMGSAPKGGDTVMTIFNSRSYPVTPVASQHYSSTLVALTYSGHGHAVRLLLSTTLGLYSIHSLPHLTIYPVCS